jgi:CBS domain-containing protein
MNVEDIMTAAVITLKESDSVRLADLEMKLGQMRHLPVIDEKGRVVGVLSSSDIYRAFGESGRRRKVPVAEIMSRNVRTVNPSVPAHVAVRIMLDHKIGSLPVVSDGQALVGIVTETDFLNLVYRLLRHPMAHVA